MLSKQFYLVSMDRIISEYICFQYTQYRLIEATNVTTTVVEPEARIIMKGNLFYIINYCVSI